MDLGSSSVLVTGATGFLGRFLVDRLLALGSRVRGLVRSEAELPGVEQVAGDLADPASLDAAVAGVDAIVHTAASFSLSFQESAATNLGGTSALLEAALAHGVGRFVHISTCGVYDLVGVDVVTEDTPRWPYTDDTDPFFATLKPGGGEVYAYVYGRVKAQAERAVEAAQARGLPAVILRPCNILGPGPRSPFGHAIPRAVVDGKVGVYGDGNNTWPVVSVHNLVDAIELALVADAAVGRAYTVVDDHTTWREYIERIAAWAGIDEVREDPPDWPYDTWQGRFDTARIRDEIGYQPKVGYDRAMEEIRAHLVEAGIVSGA